MNTLYRSRSPTSSNKKVAPSCPQQTASSPTGGIVTILWMLPPKSLPPTISSLVILLIYYPLKLAPSISVTLLKAMVLWTRPFSLYRPSLMERGTMGRLKWLPVAWPDKLMKILMMSVKYCCFSCQSLRLFTLLFSSCSLSNTIGTLDYWKYPTHCITSTTQKPSKSLTSDQAIRYFLPVYSTTIHFTKSSTLLWSRLAPLYKRPCLIRLFVP